MVKRLRYFASLKLLLKKSPNHDTAPSVSWESHHTPCGRSTRRWPPQRWLDGWRAGWLGLWVTGGSSGSGSQEGRKAGGKVAGR